MTPRLGISITRNPTAVLRARAVVLPKLGSEDCRRAIPT
jgi:hypothetical protein